jgi:general secretion pathway protein K
MRRVRGRVVGESRGVALLTALVLVAIATAIAAAIFFDTGLVLRRTEGSGAQERAGLIVGGSEALAAALLREDLDTGDAPIHGGQRWANPLGPIEVEPGSVLQADLRDLQGRFNLNSLIGIDGRVDPVALALFERLLRTLEIEPVFAVKLADWLDADDQAMSGGGEDDAYTLQAPGYRPPNRPITSVGELRWIPGFDEERFARLEPHVAALPRDAAINLCTATPALLDALANERQWVGAEDALQRNRERGCFPLRQDFRNGFAEPLAFEQLAKAVGLGERSRYFRLRSIVVVGTASYTLYSLLRYESAPPAEPTVRVLRRHWAE